MKSPLKITTWVDENGFTCISGECSECHSFPCKHSDSSDLSKTKAGF